MPDERKYQIHVADVLTMNDQDKVY